MNKDVATLIGRFDVLVFVPIMTFVLISGNVHMPSDFGIYLGFFIQWFIVGIVVGALVWTVARKKTGTGFAPKAGCDPSYEPVRHGLYRYRIVG